MRLCVFAQCYNELSKGNLLRWLSHVRQYADWVVVYDDGSTDGSADLLKREVDIFIDGRVNDFREEIAHKQALMDQCLKAEPPIDWFLWLDIDEVLDRIGTGSLREFCERAGLQAYYFPEITLWRSGCWMRRDYLGQGTFLRLWRNDGKMRFPECHRLHGQQYPQGLVAQGDAFFSVIHYGYASTDQILSRWFTRNRLGVPVAGREPCLDESRMLLEHVPHDAFPL